MTQLYDLPQELLLLIFDLAIASPPDDLPPPPSTYYEDDLYCAHYKNIEPWQDAITDDAFIMLESLVSNVHTALRLALTCHAFKTIVIDVVGSILQEQAATLEDYTIKANSKKKQLAQLILHECFEAGERSAEDIEERLSETPDEFHDELEYTKYAKLSNLWETEERMRSALSLRRRVLAKMVKHLGCETCEHVREDDDGFDIILRPWFDLVENRPGYIGL